MSCFQDSQSPSSKVRWAWPSIAVKATPQHPQRMRKKRCPLPHPSGSSPSTDGSVSSQLLWSFLMGRQRMQKAVLQGIPNNVHSTIYQLARQTAPLNYRASSNLWEHLHRTWKRANMVTLTHIHLLLSELQEHSERT